MKIKTDFVTNSSSASFIIAVRKGLTVEDVKEELLKDEKVLKSYLDGYKRYWKDVTYEDDIVEIMRLETEKDQIDLLASKLAEEIAGGDILKYSLEIGDFKAFAYEGSSEDIDLFSNWLYSFANINTDNLKIEGFN